MPVTKGICGPTLLLGFKSCKFFRMNIEQFRQLLGKIRICRNKNYILSLVNPLKRPDHLKIFYRRSREYWNFSSLNFLFLLPNTFEDVYFVLQNLYATHDFNLFHQHGCNKVPPELWYNQYTGWWCDWKVAIIDFFLLLVILYPYICSL